MYRVAYPVFAGPFPDLYPDRFAAGTDADNVNMLFNFEALSVFLLITALLSLVLAISALFQPKTPFVCHYAGLMLAAAAYAAGYGLELASSDLGGMLAMLRLQYLGIPFVPYFWVGLAYSYLEPGGLPRRWNLFLLAVALLVLLVTQTNNLHHLYYTQIDYVRINGLAIARSSKGVLYWCTIAYLNLWSAVGVMLLFRAWRQAIPLYRRQALLLLAGSLLPWGFHLLYQLGDAPIGIDMSPFGISATGILFTVAALRHRVLSVLPLARDLVLDGIAEGVVVLDTRGCIIDFNRAATLLLPKLDLSLIGRDCADLIDPKQQGIVVLPPQRGEEGRKIELRCDRLRDRRGREVGSVLLVQDISEKMAMIEELRQLATTDSLTGCYNRRFLFELCQQLARSARRDGRPLSLIILDIDDFKIINDRDGHPAGDLLLSRVSAILRNGLRASDALGRYGGDEFIVVLPETAGPVALHVAEKLAKACATECGVCLSLGVAQLLEQGEGVDDLLSRADLALYRAKSEGKNRAQLDPASVCVQGRAV